MQEGNDGSGLKPSADAARLEDDLAFIGVLARKWDRLRIQTLAAKKARADIRGELGPCTGRGPEQEDASPCWSLKTIMLWENACPSCKAQAPLHEAYHAAVGKSSAALRALRRQIRRLEASAAKPGEAASAEPEQSSPVTPELPQGNPQERTTP